MPILAAYARRKPMIEAQQQLERLTAITFPSWSGPSPGKVPPHARKGNKMRQDYQSALVRQSRGLGRYDAIEGVDLLQTSDDVRRWLGGHGIAA